MAESGPLELFLGLEPKLYYFSAPLPSLNYLFHLESEDKSKLVKGMSRVLLGTLVWLDICTPS